MNPLRSLLLGALCLVLPVHAAPSGNEAALERGLEAIQADAMRADLEFIAADELGGRDTPSQGLRLAARYLRSRMQRLGFQPAGDAGSYFHVYELERVTMDLEASAMRVLGADGESALELFEDYAFFSSGAMELELEAPVRFVGSGSEADFAGRDLSGAWALVEASEEVSWRARQANAKAAGAIGIVTFPSVEGDGNDGTLRYARHSLRKPGMRVPSTERAFPNVYLSRSGAAKLFGKRELAVGDELPVRLAEKRIVSEREVVRVENVAALWPGDDPELSKEVIILSAHYDHVGQRGDVIWNGADDNGSGTCGLLALADSLVAYGPMKRSILILWVSGEEKGLLGSEAWAKDPTLAEGQRAVLNLNIDMIGRNAPDYLLITPTSEHEAYNALTKMAEANGPLEGFPQLGSADAYWARSDHMNFNVHMGLPVAFLFSDVHEDYHQPSDTIEKIDFDKMRRVTRLVLRMLDGLQGKDLDL